MELQLLGTLALLAAFPVMGDLRLASTPRSGFRVRQRADAPYKFVNTTAVYIEPAVFGYQGLMNQRAHNYDNFLRSNIDNEQDLRNFFDERGRDHLPFRTSNALGTDLSGQLKEALTVYPGQHAIIPIRWNNPHASELEVNVWIVGSSIVVFHSEPKYDR